MIKSNCPACGKKQLVLNSDTKTLECLKCPYKCQLTNESLKNVMDRMLK